MITKQLFFLPIALSFVAVTCYASADDTLPAPAAVQESDGHMSWHEFRHELGAYPKVSSSMSSDGVVQLNGYVTDAIAKKRIGHLARQVRGATDIRNRLGTSD